MRHLTDKELEAYYAQKGWTLDDAANDAYQRFAQMCDTPIACTISQYPVWCHFCGFCFWEADLEEMNEDTQS